MIRVSKLFGVFNHTIPLNLADRMTIIHGPNGFGKTAILHMIQNLLGGQFGRLRRLPFEKVNVNFEDGRELIVVAKRSPKAGTDEDNAAAALHFELKPLAGESQEHTIEFSSLRDGVGFPLELIERQIEELERIGRDVWHHIPTGRQLHLEDVLEMYGEILPYRTHRPKQAP